MTEAFIMAEKVIRNHVEDKNKLDPNLVDSAIGQLIQDQTALESNPRSLAELSFSNYVLGKDAFYNRNLIKSAREVTLSGMIAAARKFLPSLLNKEVAQTAILCNPSEVKDINQNFNKFGVKLTSYDSIDDIFVK